MGQFEYVTAEEKAREWGVGLRTVQVLCKNGKVDGAIKFGASWAIPKGTPKPFDQRYTKHPGIGGRR
jgi:hypothetical protein